MTTDYRVTTTHEPGTGRHPGCWWVRLKSSQLGERDRTIIQEAYHYESEAQARAAELSKIFPDNPTV